MGHESFAMSAGFGIAVAVLIITGDQGSGKSQCARGLAANVGTYDEIEPEDLVPRFANILIRQPAVIILNGSPASDREFAALKTLIRTDPFLIVRQGDKVVKVRRPYVIVTTNDASFPNRLQQMPFSVIRLRNAAATPA